MTLTADKTGEEGVSRVISIIKLGKMLGILYADSSITRVAGRFTMYFFNPRSPISLAA